MFVKVLYGRKKEKKGKRRRIDEREDTRLKEEGGREGEGEEEARFETRERVVRVRIEWIRAYPLRVETGSPFISYTQ